jgi:hypothetical protein
LGALGWHGQHPLAQAWALCVRGVTTLDMLNAIPWAIAGDRIFPVAGRPYRTMSGPFLVSWAYDDSSGGTSLRLLPMPLSVDGMLEAQGNVASRDPRRPAQAA